jgi:replicative DNA helicase
MQEVIDTNMEKLFFSYIMENSEQFYKVEPFFFKNTEISFVYQVIREEYLKSKNKVIPTPKQILAMVQLYDTDEKISKNVLKILLTENTKDVEMEWLEPRFKAWKLSNHSRSAVLKAIEQIRSIKDIDYDNVKEVTQTIQNTFSSLTHMDDDDNDLGDDFDDPEKHKQLLSLNKIHSGWSCIDKLLGGGWDLGTLNVILGETNVGKSIWMQNMAVNLADNGGIVLYITLEMASRKCMKRMGSMRLKIPVDQYDTMSKDTQFMKKKINDVINNTGTNDLFNSKPGKIFVKKYNTSDCTVSDIDNYVKKFEETKRIKVNAIFVDYIGIMSIEKGYDFSSMLYLKGKHLAEGLRRIADKYKCIVITATQTDKSVWGASDIKIDDIPESKAIAESADTVWAIIRNSEMKKNNVYWLKILKLRDGEHHEEKTKFDFNQSYLTIENDTFIGSK